MHPIPVILIFDIGKTNKKLFLFDEGYQLVYEASTQFAEIKDEEGEDGEDLNALTHWIQTAILSLKQNKTYEIKQVHYAAYGASFVYINEAGKPILPLYNYLKPFKQSTKQIFEQTYGSMEEMCLATASPYLGNLNSGLQLFRLKVEQPEKFKTIKWALHLPQYVHYIVTGEFASDITSIGCHTMLWDFTKNKYHDWVINEKLDLLFPAIKKQVGLHDSSAALIPYLSSFSEPFLLISTGTWCISLNPFNEHILTNEELNQDALCYLSYSGKPIKAARLFSGKEHELAVLALNKHFNTPTDYYTKVKYNASISIDENIQLYTPKNELVASQFTDYETAYHYLIADLVKKQIISTNLIIANSKVKRIFVDGGFSNNEIFMSMLAKGYSQYEVFSAAIPQASSIGAALAVHEKWNSKSIPNNLISLQYYSTKNQSS
jgi:sugar (pentulose or hexulose) kinase